MQIYKLHPSCIIILFAFSSIFLLTKIDTVFCETVLPAIIIVYDDGYIHDITKAFPVHQKMNAPAVSSINPDTIGNRERMNTEGLKKLQSAGWEISSHGLYHAHLGPIKINKKANKGSTYIKVSNAYLLDKRYMYYIQEKNSNKKEKISIEKIIINKNNHYISIKSLLKSNYSKNAFIIMHKESMRKEIAESKNRLSKLGFPVISFVYPYNGISKQAKGIVREHYFFARAGKAEKEDFPEAFINVPPMKCRELKGTCFENDLIDDKDLDKLLERTAQLRGLLILYAHSGDENFCVQRLKHILKTAEDLGMNIVTFRDLITASTLICR